MGPSHTGSDLKSMATQQTLIGLTARRLHTRFGTALRLNQTKVASVLPWQLDPCGKTKIVI